MYPRGTYCLNEWLIVAVNQFIVLTLNIYLHMFYLINDTQIKQNDLNREILY